MSFPVNHREKVVETYLHKKKRGKKTSFQKIGKRFGIAKSTVRNWIKRYQGSIDSLLPLASPGRPRKLSGSFVLNNLVPTVIKHNLYHQHIDLAKLISVHKLDLDRRTVCFHFIFTSFFSYLNSWSIGEQLHPRNGNNKQEDSNVQTQL